MSRSTESDSEQEVANLTQHKAAPADLIDWHGEPVGSSDGDRHRGGDCAT